MLKIYIAKSCPKLTVLYITFFGILLHIIQLPNVLTIIKTSIVGKWVTLFGNPKTMSKDINKGDWGIGLFGADLVQISLDDLLW